MNGHGLTKLSGDLFYKLIIDNLTHLDLSYNALQEIPAPVFKCTKLVEMNLSNNKLRELDRKIGMTYLVRLCAQSAKYTKYTNYTFSHLADLCVSLKVQIYTI